MGLHSQGLEEVPFIDRTPDNNLRIEMNDVGSVSEQKYNYPTDGESRFVDLEWDKSCFMRDGRRQIDYVLAFEDEESTSNSTPCTEVVEISCEDVNDTDDDSTNSSIAEISKKKNRRKFFEQNLRKMGLELEVVDVALQLGMTKFVLIHAPFHVLEKQAKVMGVRLPVREIDVEYESFDFDGILDQILATLKLFDFSDRTQKLLTERDYYTAPYSAERKRDFLNSDQEDTLFPCAERSRMVYDLLIRAKYDGPHGSGGKHFGIERLLGNGTYSACYPLHQSARPTHEIPEGGERTQREVLIKHWASWKTIIKYQPLDCIRRYFGTKVAFYFTWLGYYTRTLYWAAFLGILSVVYGLFNISEDVVSNDICGTDGIGSRELLCPACDRYCDFQRLNNSCVYAKVSYLFDNGATVIFAGLMSIWATLFLEGWKRYHAEIAWKWGLMDVVVEEDTVRPEFQFRVKTKRMNPVTKLEEPYLSKAKKIANGFASGSTVLFFLLLVMAVVFGMVVYRVICMRLLAIVDHPTVDSYAFIIVSTSAAIINLIVIMAMNYVYNSIAHRLTRWECPRTQTDFDNSYTFKVFLFQFVNYYSSLFYIAFFKGLLSQIPGTRDDDGNVKIGGYRLEGCDAAGCFAELVIQLAIIMCGRQFFSAMIESFYPTIMSLLRKWQLKVPQVVESEEQRNQRIREEKAKNADQPMKRWELDYYLNLTYDQFLFDEYLEMVLQFGFVTLFVAAFPLAPLFAVLNNILEIRSDAKKFLLSNQRPNPAQAKNIGIWLNILDVISKASVTINALVIAFTSDFVPKTMYLITHRSMIGYVDSSLSYFDSTDYDFSHSQFKNVSYCRYRGYRRTPCSLFNGGSGVETCDDGLGFSYEWWKIFAARLLFVVVFEHVVFIIKILFEYLIPDIPTKIFIQQQRERYLFRQTILGEMSGNSTNRSPRENAANADGITNAFQPGSFDDKDHHYPVLFQRRNGNNRNDVEVSRKSTAASMDSFVTASQGPGGSNLTLSELNSY